MTQTPTPAEQAQADFSAFSTSFQALVAHDTQVTQQLAERTIERDTLQARIDAALAILNPPPAS